MVRLAVVPEVTPEGGLVPTDSLLALAPGVGARGPMARVRRASLRQPVRASDTTFAEVKLGRGTCWYTLMALTPVVRGNQAKTLRHRAVHHARCRHQVEVRALHIRC